MTDQIPYSNDFDNRYQYLSIPQFYSGKNIFITGATGFVGKVLIEKLLRSCPDIGNIYILVRPKKGINPNERLQQSILNSNLFDTIKENRPNDLNKIIVISGDITSDELGISSADKEILVKNVSVVFHAGANVRFNADLKTIIDSNVTGTRKMINLCKQMKLLKAFVYISTSFSNYDKQHIGEIIYNQPYNAVDITAMCNWMPEEILKKITPDLIGKKPNTYTFSKSLAEQIISIEGHQLPAAIVRPSIIGATYKEPIPGFVDGYGGCTASMCAIGSGVWRVVRLNKKIMADVIPSDLVINTIIAAAWQLNTDESLKSKLIVYNSVIGNQNSITWNQFIKYILLYFRKHPLDGFVRYVYFKKCQSYKCVKFLAFFLHYIPAVFIDFGLKCVCMKPRMMKIKNRVDKLMYNMNFFLINTWKYDKINVQNLIWKMSVRDRENFPIDASGMKWNEYVENYCLGVRHYVLKQDRKSLDKCRRQMIGSCCCHYMLFICLIAILPIFCLIYLYFFNFKSSLKI